VPSLFNAEERERIRRAIADAEMMTSGEIRVFFEPKSSTDNPYERALQVFANLEMHKTAERNGVLFYMAFKDHKFALVGDEAIYRKVEPSFWDDVLTTCIGLFKEAKYVDGLERGIAEVGKRLKQHFPRNTDDKNELPDDIILHD
jgi:uncharacterized membrane protein